jgi:hypothetical protein
MKKNYLFLTGILLLIFLTGNAQTPTFIMGDKVLNFGVGFGNYVQSDYQSTLPALSASFEAGVADLGKATIGVGAFVGYSNYKENNYDSDDYWTFNKFVIGARGNLHYPIANKLDTYGSLMLGLKNESYSWQGSGSPANGNGGTQFAIGLYIGSRYYFTDKFAAMAELGLGIDIFHFGVALKL